MYRCTCCIVPRDVFDRFSTDRKLDADQRRAAGQAAALSDQLRQLRDSAQAITATVRAQGLAATQLAAKPQVTVYDARHTQTLPGSPVASPAKAKDLTAKRAYVETQAVAQFYKQAFKRNSIDDGGMTLMSTVHYGQGFNNAMWNGSQMVYGDGDGQLFTDFTGGNDVIGHELTHGVTQHTLQLGYTGDAGGLNESISDCFGSMFRQWQAGQDAAGADWLIGKDIIGPQAAARGYTCLRDMANPANKKALAAQPTQYSELHPGMDPHYTSGPPNLAFCTAAKAAGGNSWQTVGPVWYAVLTGSGPQPAMTMPQFAARTRQVASQLGGTSGKLLAAVDAGWKAVGL